MFQITAKADLKTELGSYLAHGSIVPNRHSACLLSALPNDFSSCDKAARRLDVPLKTPTEQERVNEFHPLGGTIIFWARFLVFRHHVVLPEILPQFHITLYTRRLHATHGVSALYNLQAEAV